MLWKITYEVGKGTVCETLTDIVEAIDLEDAAEIGEEQNCRLKKSYVRRWKFRASRPCRDFRRRR